jgi:RNA polymerase sigma-70 factor (ECF subfamily)
MASAKAEELAFPPLLRLIFPNKSRDFYVYRVEHARIPGKAYLTVARVTEDNEVELVTRAKNGERDAFSELVCIHAEGVRNVIYRMCGDAQIAEDAAQETFIQAWLHLASYRPQTSLRNWLYRIAVNAATDILRKEKRILPNALEDLQLSDPQPGPEAVFSQEERTALIQTAILSLPDACRPVLVLREYEGFSYYEIADALDIPVGTVMSRLNYARTLLREKLEPIFFLQVEAEHV